MTLDSEVEALKKVPLFRGVDDSKLRLLAFISERVAFKAGERLIEQGEQGEVAYIILSGEADVLIRTDTGEQRVAHLKQYDFVGEVAILIDVPRTATVQATCDMHALAIGKENFFKLLRNFPDMAVEVMRALAHRLEQTTRDVGRLRSNVAEA